MANNPTPEQKSAFIADEPGSVQRGNAGSSVYPFLDDAESQKLQAEMNLQARADSPQRSSRRKSQPAARVAQEKDAESSGPEIYFLGFLVVVLFVLVCMIVYLFVFDLPRLQEIVNAIASLFGQ